MFQFRRGCRFAVLGPLVIAFLLLLLAFSQNIQADDRETLRVGGTGAALGGMNLLAEAFMQADPEVRVVVLPSLGSGGGIKALVAGKIDLAVSARPLKASEQAEGLVEKEYARTPVVFASREDTWAEGVRLAQLHHIYSGEVNAWPDGTRLRLVMRPATETDTKLLRGLSPEMDKAVEVATERRDLFVAINDQDNASALEDIRGSLGLISLAQMKTEQRRLKPLALDGMEGTLQALQDGTYPYAKSLYLISPPKPARPAAAFMRFVWSPEGRRILTSHGNLVTEPPEAANM